MNILPKCDMASSGKKGCLAIHFRTTFFRNGRAEPVRCLGATLYFDNEMQSAPAFAKFAKVIAHIKTMQI